MTRVLHVIHSTKLGGVEVAASTLRSGLADHSPDVEYRLMALGRDASAGVEGVRPDAIAAGLNSPVSAVSVVRYARKARAEVLVASLWRSVLVGLFVKALVPRTRLVVWVHNTRYTNALDRLVHTVAFACADGVFADSAAARDTLVPRNRRSSTVVVAPIVTDRAQRGAAERRDPKALVYWGRLSPQKRLDRAVRLLAELKGFHLDVYGPDEGVWSDVSALAEGLGVRERLTWHGAVQPEEIDGLAERYSFFVQLSDFEGLGMAVVEALSHGLVPVVTPVGEIGSYTVDEESAIHVAPEDLERAAERVRSLAADPAAFLARSEAARAVRFPGFFHSFSNGLKAVTR